MERFIVKDRIEGSHCLIVQQEHHHLKHVLRKRTGDLVEVIDGSDTLYRGTIKEISHDYTEVVILDALTSREPKHRIHLLIGLLKGDKFEWVIQKAVELGVYEIIPIIMKNSIAKIEEKKIKHKLERWNRIAESAQKQCGRNYLPIVQEPQTLKGVIEDLSDEMPILVFYEQGTDSLKTLLKGINQQDIYCIIGPEGGIDESEVLFLKEHKALFATLGPRILRAETAAITSIPLLLYELGDME